MNEEHSSKASHSLLIALQRGIPLVRRPWAAMGQALGIAEADVLSAARDLIAKGVARRFGGVFDSRRLGYGSTLCAVDAPGEQIEQVAALLKPHPGVTHCYEREGRPNLWFTMTAPADKLEDELHRVADAIRPCPLLNLPAIRRFKVEVVLDAAEGDVESVRGMNLPGGKDEDAPAGFTAREKALVRTIQGNLQVDEEPFAAPALEAKWNQDELLDRLASWKDAGVLRRIGFILRHRAIGFAANGMCVWPVPANDVERAGRILAGEPEVTHCYERPSSPSVPYNLYAMIHARERSAAAETFRRLSEKAGLTGGRMLVSSREFKKSSPVFFLEADEMSGKPTR